jgi:hypothetical protein
MGRHRHSIFVGSAVMDNCVHDSRYVRGVHHNRYAIYIIVHLLLHCIGANC